VELVHAKKAREVDTREKVSSGNTDLFCRGKQVTGSCFGAVNCRGSTGVG
jgi:hypothetical protein